MINFTKKISRKFSTLIVPDCNRLSKDVSILYKAAKKIDKDISVLQLSQNNKTAEEFYQNQNKLDCEINLLEHEDFEGKSYELASHVISKFFNEKKFDKLIMGNSFIAKELLPRISV